MTGLAILPALATACSCVGERTACHAAFSSEVIFTGRVVAMAAAPDETQYTFAVHQAIKGTADTRVDLRAGNHGSACGVIFEKDKDYLIFAGRSGGQLSTNLCSGNKELALAGEELRFFQGLRAGWPLESGLLYGVVTQRQADLSRLGPVTWPVAGAKVTVMVGAAPVAETRTTAGGAYQFAHLPQGNYRVVVDAPGDFRSPRRGATVFIGPGKCEEVSFFNAARAQLKGVLRDSDGELDGSTDVILVPLAGTPKELTGEPSELKTDPDSGVFLLEVPPGRYRVGFVELGYTDVVYFPRAVELKGGQTETIEYQLPARPVQIVHGRVVDERGRPLAGAQVLLHGEGPDGSSIGGRVLTAADGGFRFQSQVLDYTLELRVPACGEKTVARGSVKRASQEPLVLVNPAICP
ncbi:MAG: carboxypeptidase regulatory-like domain-containing protein [Bryobacteraceae bacterium]